MHEAWPDVVVMAGSGFCYSAVLPALLTAGRRARPGRGPTPHPAAALALAVAVHAAVVWYESTGTPSWPQRLALQAGLLLSGVVFWLPAVGPRRLPGPARCLYLFLAAPLLDIPAVCAIGVGHRAGGLAMIVGMLPLALVALGDTWRWITAEEHAAARSDAAA